MTPGDTLTPCPLYIHLSAFRIWKFVQVGFFQLWGVFFLLVGFCQLWDFPLPPPSRHLEPPFSVGEVGRLNPYHRKDFTMRFTARPRMGGRHAAGRIFD